MFHEPESATFNKTAFIKRIFFLKRISGSHHIFFNADLRKTIVVPMHGKKDIPTGTFLSII